MPPSSPPPDREAVSYLRDKGLRAGFSYRDIWAEEHTFDFTVAKAMDLELLGDLRDSIADAKQRGQTQEAWLREMEEMLSKRGWWGRKEMEDPVTGETVVAQLGSSRRLKTIWLVNMRQASQAGRWERGSASTSHPYILYRVGSSREHRPEHLAWDGLLLPKDDPFWKRANPSNGYGCKCFTRFVSERAAQRYRERGIPKPIPAGQQRPSGTKKVRTVAPKLIPTTWYDKRVQQTRRGFHGIDPGFEHNVGEGREEQIADRFRRSDADFAKDVKPAEGMQDLEHGLRFRGLAGEQRRFVNRALGAVGQVHGIPKQDRGAAVRSIPGPLGRSRRGRRGIGAIDVGEDSWRPELMALHEIGHFVDDVLGGGSYASTAEKPTDAMAALLEAVRASAAWAASAALPDDERKIWRRPSEVFARVYSQYVAWRSGSIRLRRQMDRALQSPELRRRLLQWGYEDWLPVMMAMDRLLTEAKWLTRR